jgi:hypothetical protein
LLLGNDSVSTFPRKHTPSNNRMSIARQRISKQASTIEKLNFLRGPCLVVIKAQRKSFERVVRNWVEFWRWQSKMIEKKWQETN